MFYSYILYSEKDGRYYYGSCEDILGRLKTHNAGRVTATKFRRPLRLHYYESFATRIEARKREAFYKSIEGYRYLREEGIIPTAEK